MPTPVSRLSGTFGRIPVRRPLLIGHLPAGYPTIEDSLTALRALSRHVDILGVDLPHPDLAPDNPAVHAATRAALSAGITQSDVIGVVRELTATVRIPVMLMSPWAPIARSGPTNMAAALAAAGASGVVLPGLAPIGSGATRWLHAARAHRLGTTFMAAGDYLPGAAAHSTSWVYLPLVDEDETGGAEADNLLDLTRLRRRTLQLRQSTCAPICVGDGISSPSQAAEVVTMAQVDGIVIGSAFVRSLMYARTFDQGITCLHRRARQYSQALRPRRRRGKDRAVA
ncbi:tryptophan synthase subunit alpha [Streptomyces sp. NPDC050428]|uniref:tryptophan synthase subunit alpha n=1 Tax=Streptomyces sp. NPDC050428 TaxID=3155757 RepID=UPI0034354016